MGYDLVKAGEIPGFYTILDTNRPGPEVLVLGEFGWDGAAGAFSLVDTKNKISVAYFQEMFGWDLKIQKLITNALYSCIE